jgi:hypothetical protein
LPAQCRADSEESYVKTTTFESNGVSALIGAMWDRRKRAVCDRASAAVRGAHTRRAGRALPLALFVAVLSLVLAPASAQALLVHIKSIGSAGTGAGQFDSPQGVAVDQSTGDFYVVDALNYRVEKFDSSGNFILAFGQGVDQTTGADVCTAASGDTCQAGTQGSSPGEFMAPQFIAVDPTTGDVYVGDPGDDTVTKFDSSGALITSWPSGAPTGQLSGASTFGSIDGITVDPSGNLLVINNGNPVYEFAADGSSVTNFTTTRGMSPDGLDVTPDFSTASNTGSLYKVNGDGSTEKFTPSTGAFVTIAGDTSPSISTTELTVDRSTGDLYVDTGTYVGHFVFNSSGQVVENGASPCTPADSAGCQPTDTFGTNVLSAGTGVGFYSAATMADVADAGNNNVAIFGPPSPGPPVIDNESSSNIGQFSATINAEVNPFGVDTTCTFQYVLGTTFQSSGFSTATTVPCSPTDLGSTFNDQAASAGLTGLTLGTTYDFRVIATNSDGTTDGNAATFTTLGPAEVDSESASNIGQTTATLNAEVNPLGNDTSCQFQYVDDATFQVSGYASATTVACTPSDLGSGTSDVAASANISGLSANTLYHFRVVATNTLGTQDGADTTFTTAPPFSIDSESASNIESTVATLNAQINPEGNDTTCQFQYVDDATFKVSGYASATTVACSPSDLGSGTSDVATSAQISGLTPNTLYHFEVVGSNSLGTLTGNDTTFTTTPPVVIDSESVTNITDTGATLKAQINPEGTDTTYQFEYGPTTAYGTTVPAMPVDIGSGATDVAASVDLTGLTPGATYHFAVVATNALTPALGTPGADHSFATFSSIPPAGGLPDNRAYELVSPVDKSGGEAYGAIFQGDQAATNGNAMAYVSLNQFPGSTGPGINYVATRGATGWTTQPILPPQAPASTLELVEYQAFSPDLSKAVLLDGGGSNGGTGGQDSPPLDPGTCTAATPPAMPTTPCTGEPSGVPNLFLWDSATNSFQLVNSYADAPSGVTIPTPNSGTPPAFQGASADFSHILFTEGAQLTSPPTGPLAPTGTNLYDWSGGVVHLVGVLPDGTAAGGGTLGGTNGRALNAVSSDGSRVIFTGSDGNLYQRVNDATTTELDTANTGAAGPSGGGQFMTASTDGTKVFFLDAAQLTNDSTAASGQPDLYEWDASKPAGSQLTDLSVDASQPANVQGVLGASTDGSYVYFVATGDFGQSGPTNGSDNLYVSHNAGTPTFIATLSGNDSSDWTSSLTSRVTPDGLHAAFNSVAPLTGYNNTDPNTGNADTEIFLYSVGSGTLVCASCNPTGNTVGSSALDGVVSGLYLQHELSDDGSRVFFDSTDVLSPRATNGKQNVFEYENGQIYLISSGTSTSDSILMDASSDGSDVFFLTRDNLVAGLSDAGRYNVFDARVNGGFPAPSPVPPCNGEACKPPAPPTPAPPVIGTVTFTGPGNTPSVTSGGKMAIAARKVLNHFSFSLDVVVPGAGKITITGSGLKTVRKSVKSDGTYTLTVNLTKAERNRLAKKHKHKMMMTVHVMYVPATGAGSTTTFTLTVKG